MRRKALSEKISVIVPAFNEKRSLADLVRGIMRTLSAYSFDHELVIVADGSTDGTSELADQLARDGFVKVIHHSFNRGKSMALRTGFRLSTGSIQVMMDADFQYLPDEIPRILAPIIDGQKDVVNGRRTARKDKRTRLIASEIYNWLLRRLFRMNACYDNNSGFKAFRREVFETIAHMLRKDFHRLLIPMAAHSGFRIGEVNITHSPRTTGRSKYSSPKRLVSGLLDILLFRLQLALRQEPILTSAYPWKHRT